MTGWVKAVGFSPFRAESLGWEDSLAGGVIEMVAGARIGTVKS